MERVIFSKGEQRKFILNVCKDNSFKKFLENNSSILDIPYSTFKKYCSERLTLPINIFNKLCTISNIDKKELNVKTLNENWGAVKGGKKGIRELFRKYDTKILNEWRSKGGKKSIKKIRQISLKEISLPKATNEKLSELIGVYLGDGTLTKYFLRISGDKRYDLNYFEYLSCLIESILKIKPKIRVEKNRNLIYLEVCSKRFCDFLKNNLRLNYGDKIKNKNKIPRVILKNRKLLFSCLRGLVDTDGSVSKDGGILSIRFRSHSNSLLNQLNLINKNFDIFTFKNDTEIGTRSQEKIKKYFKEIGSSNLSHIVRFNESLKGNIITKKEALKYYSIYNKIKLPFMGP